MRRCHSIPPSVADGAIRLTRSSRSPRPSDCDRARHGNLDATDTPPRDDVSSGAAAAAESVLLRQTGDSAIDALCASLFRLEADTPRIGHVLADRSRVERRARWLARMARRQIVRARADPRRRKPPRPRTLSAARRDGDERRSAIVVQLRSRGRVPDAGHPAALSDEPRLRGGGPRPASRRAAVSVAEAFRERRAAHQPVSPIVERRRLPLRLHAPQPRVAEGSRRPVRLVDVRHRSVRATARRRTDDLSLLRATRQRQRLRRAAVHAGAGFDAVRRAAGAAERRVEVQARLGRVPRRDGAAQHPPGLHDVRGVAVARGVSRGALSGLPGIRGSSVQQDRVVRTSPGRRAIRAGAPVPGVLSCPWHSAAPEREPGRVAVSVYTLDPLGDRRWPAFVDERPDASVFHTPAWLDALRRTYGYAPVVYTTT